MQEAPLSIEQLAIRELETEKNPPSIADLAIAFDQEIRKGGAFAWIGITTEPDEHQRISTHVYLSEITQNSGPHVPFVIDAFDSLSLALEPRVITYLHLIRDTDLPTDELKTRINEACSQPEKQRQLLLQEDLPQT